MPLAHPLDASAYRFYLWQRTLFIFIWIFTIIHLHLLDAGSDGSRRPHFIKCFYFENVLVFRWLPCICCAIWFTIEMRERKEEKKKEFNTGESQLVISSNHKCKWRDLRKDKHFMCTTHSCGLFVSHPFNGIFFIAFFLDMLLVFACILGRANQCQTIQKQKRIILWGMS